MSQIATTKMSTRGQVVIPEAIRQALGLEAGSQFMVIADKDVILLKALARPSMENFDALRDKARKAAKKAGLTPKDLEKIITEVRKNK